MRYFLSKIALASVLAFVISACSATIEPSGAECQRQDEDRGPAVEGEAQPESREGVPASDGNIAAPFIGSC